MTNEARIERYVPTPPNHDHRCADGDEKAAEVVFTQADGSQTYLCEEHSLKYIVGKPSLVAALVLKLALQQ
jgi:hypothetical protein